jgi:hypothetical protein
VELAERHELAQRLDVPMVWFYPLLYMAVTAITYYAFFVGQPDSGVA